MKRQTRAFLLNIATAIAVAATAALVLLPTTASAATMFTTTTVNVRESPTGGVIGTLPRGTAVDAIDCSGGWCFSNAGPNGHGYIAQQFLSPNSPGPGGSIEFGVTGPNGNTINFGVNVPDNRPPFVDDEPVFDDGEACFYSRSQRRGENFCVAAGDNIPDLGGWRGEISSIDNADGLEVTVCTRTRFRGDCRTYTTNANSLGRFDNVIASVRVD